MSRFTARITKNCESPRCEHRTAVRDARVQTSLIIKSLTSRNQVIKHPIFPNCTQVSTGAIFTTLTSACLRRLRTSSSSFRFSRFVCSSLRFFAASVFAILIKRAEKRATATPRTAGPNQRIEWVKGHSVMGYDFFVFVDPLLQCLRTRHTPKT